MEVNPAVVIGIGPQAEEIIKRASNLILRRTCSDSLPGIFQFRTLSNKAAESANEIAEVYYAASNKAAAFNAEQDTGLSVDSSRVESFVVASLQPDHLAETIEVARVLKNCTRRAVAGGRNAIFLLPKRKTQEDSAALEIAAQAFDAEIKTARTFNRCFFIDQVDETGQSITADESMELVARVISLMVASELSRRLRNAPPTFIGNGPHERCYASFSCCAINFDAQRLIKALSDHLALDLSRELFNDKGLRIQKTEWPEKVQQWLQDSLRQTLTGPTHIQMADIRRDLDFQQARNVLDEFVQNASRSLGNNFGACQQVIDNCLKQGTIALESLAKEMTTDKKAINKLEIEILLGVRDERTIPGKAIVVDKPSPWILILGLLGLAIIVALLVLANLPALLLIGMVAGALLMIGAILRAAAGKKRTVPTEQTVQSPLEKKLKELEALKLGYTQKNKRLKIHVALFAYLDLAYANFENLRRRVVHGEFQSVQSVFDVDLIDAELVEKFYSQMHQARDISAESLMEGAQFAETYRTAFSFFDLKLSDKLREYCARRFGSLKSLDLELLFQLRDSLNGYRELQTASAPFWYPHDPAASEKIAFAIIPENAPQQMHTLLNKIFGGQNVNYVHSQTAGEATLLLFAYGQSLNNILGQTTSNAATRA